MNKVNSHYRYQVKVGVRSPSCSCLHSQTNQYQCVKCLSIQSIGWYTICCIQYSLSNKITLSIIYAMILSLIYFHTFPIWFTIWETKGFSEIIKRKGQSLLRYWGNFGHQYSFDDIIWYIYINVGSQ